RLVEDDQRGLVEERPGPTEARLHPRGALVDATLQEITELELLGDRLDARFHLPRPEPIERPEELEVLPHREALHGAPLVPARKADAAARPPRRVRWLTEHLHHPRVRRD